jgi:hypothetical protein
LRATAAAGFDALHLADERTRGGQRSGQFLGPARRVDRSRLPQAGRALELPG